MILCLFISNHYISSRYICLLKQRKCSLVLVSIISSSLDLCAQSPCLVSPLQGDSSRFRVQLTYESREAKDLSLETGDLVQFVEEAENGHW